jgi:hypothetical protein
MALAIVLLAAPTAAAERVELPLELDEAFLAAFLREQIFEGPDARLRSVGDAMGCQSFELSRPRVRVRPQRIRTRMDVTLRPGQVVGDRCLRLVEWRGQLELDHRPRVGRDRKSIVLEMESWRALDPGAQPDTLSTSIGRILESMLPQPLRRIEVGLDAPLAELRGLLAVFVPVSDGIGVSTLFESLEIEGVEAADGFVALTLGLEAPAPVTAPPSEPELSAEELARLDERLGDLDAFVTRTLGQIAPADGSGETPDRMLEILLGMRTELVALAADTRRRERDPVRQLFVETWDRLAGVLREERHRRTDHASGLRFVTFIGGGEMLRTLDALGPSVGLDISRDGLRRLARVLAPDDPEDPLRQDPGVDLLLRRALGFGAPIPDPDPEPGDDASWLDWLVPPAYAAEGLDRSVVRRLNRWVPRKSDMPSYLPMVLEVLRHVATEQLRTEPLERAYHGEFRLLLLATAWQESCWRQFVARDRKRVPLESRSGDVGLMQINPRVWRGLYDLHGLRWDLVYNARAGADILQNLMVRYALRHREHERTGRTDSLSRSAYAAYNGGPRSYDRYRRKDVPKHAREIDRLFYEKYRALRRDGELAVRTCFE